MFRPLRRSFDRIQTQNVDPKKQRKVHKLNSIRIIISLSLYPNESNKANFIQQQQRKRTRRFPTSCNNEQRKNRRSRSMQQRSRKTAEKSDGEINEMKSV